MRHFTVSEKLDRARRAWPLWVGVICRAVDEKYGDEGRRVVMSALRQQGQIHGRKVIVAKMNAQPTISDIIEIHKTLVQVMGLDCEYTDITKRSFVLHVNHCPMAERWQIMRAPAWMCEVWGQYVLGMYTAVNENFDYFVRKSVLNGDPYCEEVWQIK